MKLVTKPTPEQAAARQAAYRQALTVALAELAAAHAEYPDIDAAMVEEILQTGGRGHGPYGVTRLAGMVRNIGWAKAKRSLSQEEAEHIRVELFGPC